MGKDIPRGRRKAEASPKPGQTSSQFRAFTETYLSKNVIQDLPQLLGGDSF